MQQELILKHGGYRRLKSFQIARMIFDITQRFCDKFLNISSRTREQMIQAARSGVQNIAEGSQASGTSKKTEIKLTNVARASLEELKLDFEDFIRQRGLTRWDPFDHRRQHLIDRRVKCADEFALWCKEIAVRYNCDLSEAAANGMIILITVACTLLNRQIKALADNFVNEGGFTERLYKVRVNARKQP